MISIFESLIEIYNRQWQLKSQMINIKYHTQFLNANVKKLS